MTGFHKAKIVLILIATLGAIHDGWCIFLGDINLWKHIPGSIELACSLGYYGILKLERLRRKT